MPSCLLFLHLVCLSLDCVLQDKDTARVLAIRECDLNEDEHGSTLLHLCTEIESAGKLTIMVAGMGVGFAALSLMTTIAGLGHSAISPNGSSAEGAFIPAMHPGVNGRLVGTTTQSHKHSRCRNLSGFLGALTATGAALLFLLGFVMYSVSFPSHTPNRGDVVLSFSFWLTVLAWLIASASAGLHIRSLLIIRKLAAGHAVHPAS